MSKTLLIAEKPSQAREYAKALGVKGKGEGYFESDEYIISWCIGHLFELKSPESYMDLPKVGKRWGIHRLPVLPKVEEFQHALKPSTQKQYRVLERLLKSKEVGKVICGTDADREGQLLFQEVWDAVACKKPLFRLWISSLTQEAIREGMRKLRPFQEMEGLAQAGYGRSYGDWDFGMNLTEGFTALFGSFDPVRKKPNVISIGRVQTPTLALVVDREWAIQNFIPTPYIEIEAEFECTQGVYKGKWFDPAAKTPESKGQSKSKEQDGEFALNQESGKDKFSLDLARGKEIVAKVQGKPGRVHSVKEKESYEPHPLLFDLTTLTIAASKRYGFGAEKVLKIAQSLYEKKAITYPRTDCNYLPPDLLPKLKTHLKALEQSPFEEWVKEALTRPLPKGKRVINEITAHHAIIPTTERPSSNMSSDERKIWEMIVLRFLTIWFPPARYAEKEIVTWVADEFFLTKDKAMLEPGWRKVEKSWEHNTSTVSNKSNNGEDNNSSQGKLSSLFKGEEVLTRSCQAIQKETKPPKRYTQGDLIKAMEGAGREIEDETLRQQLKGKGLGTVATRAAIIENLLDRGYLMQQQKVLIPTEKGVELIRLIKEMLPNSRLLISAEMTGQMEYELAQVERGEIPLSQYMVRVEQAIRGIIEELRQYEATHGKKPIACAPPKRGAYSSKRITTSNSDKDLKSSPEQSDKKAKIDMDVLGICPNCGGPVVEREKSYGCQNWQKGCQFILWKNPICGKILTSAQVKNLLKKGKTNLIKGFRSKNGKSFSAYLVWENSSLGKLKFEFENN